MRVWSFWAIVWLGSLALGQVCSSAFYPTDPDLRWRYCRLNDNQVYTQTFTHFGGVAFIVQLGFAFGT